MKHKIASFTLLVLLLVQIPEIKSQRTIYEPLDLNKVEFSLADFGTMWTFDAVPFEKYSKKYNFKPDKAWLDNVQKAALQFGGGCSAAFVSEDGLILTNHHCFRGRLGQLQQKGENLFRDGFYAKTLSEERLFPDTYVDQLLEIKDVTAIIHSAMVKGTNDAEKVDLKEKAIKELVSQNEKEKGIVARVVTLYNGGKYSLYIYKRYSDIRLVMIPDVQITATGWDWDNFTYPRYELDFAFLRAYENGKPVKTKNFFKWSIKGAEENEPIFVVGRPGNTDRLLSVRELELYRDVRSPVILQRLNEAYHAYFKFFEAHPERNDEILSQLLSVANGRKKYAGELDALNDSYLMAKKNDFENKLRIKVENNPGLKEKYGNLWQDLQVAFNELNTFEREYTIITMAERYAPSYFQTARNLVMYAEQMLLDENKRHGNYKPGKLAQTTASIYVSLTDNDLQDWLLISHADFLYKVKGGNCQFLQSIYGGNTGNDALKFFLQNNKIAHKEYVDELLKQGAATIMNSDNPLIQYYIKTRKFIAETNVRRQAINNTIEVLNQKLGSLIFDAFGENIPPDATSTLRISDGVIKQYEYNGTIAPGKVTYYGLYDRFHSFGKKSYPWGLHPIWQVPSKGLDLSVPIGFASTNDIVGGNSGSSIINRNAEVVGLVHDGNLESLAGTYIFLEENNRAVSTDSWGLMEALKHVYKTKRLVDELVSSKIK
jgi:hypothetical protein